MNGDEGKDKKLYSKKEVLLIIDNCFHTFASTYRQEAKELATQLLTFKVDIQMSEYSEHRFILKHGEHMGANCRYCRELETKNWHYYEKEDGKMFHIRKDAISAILGGTYEDIVINRPVSIQDYETISKTDPHICMCKKAADLPNDAA